jgi:PadR family transcriptional regulator, regulatory protein PadR
LTKPIFCILLSVIEGTAKATELLQGTVGLVILKVLSLEPMHGWAIAQPIRQLSKDVLRVNHGTPYPGHHRDLYALTP